MRGGAVLIRLSILGLMLVWGNGDCPARVCLERECEMEYLEDILFICMG
jgi:hypothetical protein